HGTATGTHTDGGRLLFLWRPARRRHLGASVVPCGTARISLEGFGSRGPPGPESGRRRRAPGVPGLGPSPAEDGRWLASSLPRAGGAGAAGSKQEGRPDADQDLGEGRLDLKRFICQEVRRVVAAECALMLGSLELQLEAAVAAASHERAERLLRAFREECRGGAWPAAEAGGARPLTARLAGMQPQHARAGHEIERELEDVVGQCAALVEGADGRDRPAAASGGAEGTARPAG
ncbi:unnamed protein product, partial [Prorocentrum cordatum]